MLHLAQHCALSPFHVIATANPIDAAGLSAIHQLVEPIAVEPSVAEYCVRLAAATRAHPQLLVGAIAAVVVCLVLATTVRRTLQDTLTELGVPVVAWRGAGSLDNVLSRLSRAAQAPRLHR
jgi:hypothetical protein